MSTTTAEEYYKSGSAAWMAGFLLLGILLGMLGSLVMVWHYHIEEESSSVGTHFLAMGAGFVVSSQGAQRLLGRIPVRTVGIWATGLALLSLLSLAWCAPPVPEAWRIYSLAAAGAAAGALTYALFFANESRFESQPAVAANLAGALFVGGGLIAAFVIGSTYFSGSIHIQPLLLAIFPAVYLPILILDRFEPARKPPRRANDDILRDTLKDLRSIATMLISLLIFFQFACEWAIGGWLPIFMTRTLGSSPVVAIGALGLYFLALIIGRLVIQALLPIVSHRKMLIFSTLTAMFGYLLLSITGVTFLAVVAAVVIGLGHAAIYPLMAERLDHRFSYHPGFYSGAISFAMTGAMATPWLLGYVAEYFGMRWVMLIPAIASVVVLILAILIMFESHLMGGRRKGTTHGLLASDV